MKAELDKIQNLINDFKEKNPDESVGDLSDTYHTFNELYKHRTILTALAFLNIPYAWKSRTHDDGTMYDGMFIVGAPTPTGMITYHYDNEYWNLFKIPALPNAPHFTGYTPNDVIDRIENYIKTSSTRLLVGENLAKVEEIVEKEILPTFGEDLIAKAAYIGFYNR